MKDSLTQMLKQAAERRSAGANYLDAAMDNVREILKREAIRETYNADTISVETIAHDALAIGRGLLNHTLDPVVTTQPDGLPGACYVLYFPESVRERVGNLLRRAYLDCIMLTIEEALKAGVELKPREHVIRCGQIDELLRDEPPQISCPVCEMSQSRGLPTQRYTCPKCQMIFDDNGVAIGKNPDRAPLPEGTKYDAPPPPEIAQ